MKFTVTLKDPGFSNSVDQAVRDSLKSLDLDDSEIEAVSERRSENTWESLAKFVQYQEYVRIEFDTVAGTATVVPR